MVELVADHKIVALTALQLTSFSLLNSFLCQSNPTTSFVMAPVFFGTEVIRRHCTEVTEVFADCL